MKTNEIKISQLIKNLQILVENLPSQADFARRIYVSQPTVSDWLSGEKKPRHRYILTICAVFKIPRERLVSGELTREDRENIANVAAQMEYRKNVPRHIPVAQNFDDIDTTLDDPDFSPLRSTSASARVKIAALSKKVSSLKSIISAQAAEISALKSVIERIQNPDKLLPLPDTTATRELSKKVKKRVLSCRKKITKAVKNLPPPKSETQI